MVPSREYFGSASWRLGKKGGTIESLREAVASEVVVQDFDWINGLELLDYEVLGRGKEADANLIAHVKLTLKDREGTESEKRVTYLVGIGAGTERSFETCSIDLNRVLLQRLFVRSAAVYSGNYSNHLEESVVIIMLKQSVVPRVGSRFRAGVWLCSLLFAGGGSGVYQSAPVDGDIASETLLLVMDAWKEGETPDSLQEQTPKIVVQDLDWIGGMKLVDYEVLGDGKAVDANLIAKVKWTLLDKS